MAITIANCTPVYKTFGAAQQRASGGIHQQSHPHGTPSWQLHSKNSQSYAQQQDHHMFTTLHPPRLMGMKRRMKRRMR
jgi:hypothetical protein